MAVESDAAMARRLQAEELGVSGQMFRPLLSSNQADDARPIPPARQLVRQVRNENPTIELVKNILWCIELITTVLIVSMTWRQGQGNEQCTRLRGWIIVYSARLFVHLPLTMISFRKRQRNEPVARIEKILNWIKMLTFLWFIIGQSWIYSGACQESKTLWIYILITIIIVYIQLALPIILVLALCLCLPFAWAFLRVLQQPRSASQSAVRGLKTRKFKSGDDDIENQGRQRCVICLREYKVDDEIKTLPCGHEFHSECVDPWLGGHNRTCPTCRHDITKRFVAPPPLHPIVEEENP